MIARLLGLGLVLYGGYVVLQNATLVVKNEEWDAAPAVDADVDVVARTIWGEARGEGEAGMIAVANVIMNRVARPGWWGRTPREVCQKKWQFSCWNPTDPNLMRLLTVDDSNQAFASALEIAARAVAWQLPDITNGATNYHASSVLPDWAGRMVRVAVIGNHIFYA